MRRVVLLLAALLTVIAVALFIPTTAHADQNGGYSVPTPSASADYFDPHDQGVHGDQPKLGDWGHEGVARTAGPAQLASIACPSGKLCTYRDTLWWGDMYHYSVPFGPYPVCIEIGGTWDNEIGSVRNYSNRTVQFHTDHGCHNSGLNVRSYAPGGGDDWGFTIWDNRMSSIRWMP